MASLFTDSYTQPDRDVPLTPVELRAGVYIKRDDLFTYAGVNGGKARTCAVLARGARGLVTCGSRSSPQANIVAHIGQHLGIPVHIHTPTGELSPELLDAQSTGAVVIQHKAGYNSVIQERARVDALAEGWTEIPFGMSCLEHVRQTRAQVRNVPHDAARLVMGVGSGMSMAGVLWGLDDAGLGGMPVLGVTVGASPVKHLDYFAPTRWRNRVQLITSGTDYGKASANRLDGIRLDPHYEAKAVPFLLPGDLFWIVGIRRMA